MTHLVCIKSKRRKLAFCAFILCFSCALKAQVKPKVDIPYKSKIFQFSFESLYANTPRVLEGDRLEFMEREANYRVNFDALIPLVLKDDFKLGLQFTYDQQRFVFENFKTNLGTSLSSTFNSFDFRRTGVTIFSQKKLSNKETLSILAGAKFNGNRFRLNTETLRTSLTGLYEKNVNENRKLGAGIRLSYDEQGFRLFPFLRLEQNLNYKWNLSVTFPKEAILRYRLGHTTFLSAKTELNSYRYALLDPIEGFENSQLSIARLDIRFSLLFEKQLTDWIGIGAEYGWNNSSRHFLVERGGRRRDALKGFKSPSAPYFKFSLFLVPPSKFYK